MQRKDQIDALGAGLLISFTLVMGLGQVFIKLINEGMAPIFQAGLRSVFAAPLVLGFALITGRRISIRDGTLGPGVLCGTFFAAEFLLLYVSLEYTSVSRAVVMFYTMPFWVALWAHFLVDGERLTPVRLAGLALAVAGVALALSKNAAPATEWALVGDLMALSGAVFWAGIAALARVSRLARATAEMQLLYQTTVSSVILIGIALAMVPVTGPVMRGMTPELWAMFAFHVVVVVGIGFLAWFWVLKVYPASHMASFGFLTPLFGVSFGWLILGEAVGWRLVASLVLVATGIVLVNRR